MHRHYQRIHLLFGILILSSVMVLLNLWNLRLAAHSPSLEIVTYSPQRAAPDSHNSHLTAADRLSHIHVKLLADHHFGTLPVPPQYESTLAAKRITSDTPDLDTRIKEQDVLYVDALFFADFVREILPRIQVRFVLITADSSICMPRCGVYALKPAMNVDVLVNDSRIVKWFVTHCNMGRTVSPKIRCMPLGIDQHSSALVDMQRAYDNSVGLIDGLSLRRKHWKDHPSRYMLVSFQTSTKPELRESLWNWLCADPSLSSWGRSPETDSLRGISNCAYDNSMDRFAFYTSVVVPSIFVVSPQGFGLDCYRTYEALLLGTYPIVISSDLDVLFKDLPVLILRDWGELSVKLLETTYADFQGRKFDFSTLYVKYWKGQIRSGE